MNYVKGFWGGNAFPKFESMHQNVDELVDKDVQVVGMSFQRLYSNVVEDILPICGNTEERREQSADSEHRHVSDQICSARDIKTTTSCAEKNDLSINQGCTDTLRNLDASVQLQHDCLMHFDIPSCEDPSEEKNNNSNFREGDDTSIPDREEIEKDIASVIINACSSNEFFLTLHDEDHKNSSPRVASSPALVAYKEDQLTTRQLSFTFLDDGDSLSSASGSGWLSEGELAMLEHPNSNEGGIVSLPIEAPAPEFNTDIFGFVNSPIRCLHGALAKPEFPSNEFSTKSESSDISTSFKSLEIVSTCFSKSEEVGTMTETICSIQPADSAYSISKRSCTSATYETKPVETFPAITILESNVCSCGSSDERYHTDGQTTTAVSPPRTDSGETHEFSDCIRDLSMETIDLSPPNVQPDAKTVVSNGGFVTTSHRRKDFTYYKKLLKDRFTSRKRLSKDYKLLPLLYGDLGMESGQNFERSCVVDHESMRRHSFDDEVSETEWEML